MGEEGTTLLEGALFRIAAVDQQVWCTVVNRDDVDADEGARCAQQMQAFLISKVLTARSPYHGLVFDVSRGPRVFGPKTRASLEELFRRAEASGTPTAVVVGDAAIQKLQFRSVCQDVAPTHASVFSDHRQAASFAQGS